MHPSIATFGSDETEIRIIEIAHCTSIAFFTFAVLLNSLLIYIIANHSSVHAGNYFKNVQTIIAHIMCALIIMLSRPAIHLHGGIFFIGGHLRFLPFSFTFTVFLIYGYIAVLVHKTVAIATMTVFRVWSMSRRPSSLPSFSFPLIPIVGFSIVIPPTLFHMFLLYPTEAKQKMCFIRDLRGYCIETVGEAVRRHFPPDSGFVISPLQLGDWHNYPLTASLVITVVTMTISLTIVLVGSFLIMQRAGESNDIKMHRQLSRALILQILIPAALLHIPMAVALTGSLIGENMEILFMCMPISNALYTCLDPLGIIISVKSYRKGVKGLLRIFKSSAVGPMLDPYRNATEMPKHPEVSLESTAKMHSQ